MKKTFFAVLMLASLALAACATVPENFEERLAESYITLTEIRYTAADAVRTGRITNQQGQAILELTDSARGLLDEAADGDERGLDLAIEILDKLDRLLQ